MNKEELLQELAIKVKIGEITAEEVMNRISLAPSGMGESHVSQKGVSRFSVTNTLYAIGAAIALIGIVIFVAQIWNDIGSFGRIFVTLGLGLVITGIGSMFNKQQPDHNIGSIFHFIGGALIPGGTMVLLSEMKIDTSSLWPATMSFAVIFAFYSLLSFIHKTAVLTLFSIANGTIFMYLLVGSIVGDSYYRNSNIFAYLTMAVGSSYLFLARAFQGGWNRGLIDLLYFFGSIGFLSAAFYMVFDSVAWQLFYFLIIGAGLYLSVHMASRIILATSTAFLLAHVSYITGKYFADSIGWPVSLVILGFIFIGLGYASISINKNYIQKAG